MRDTLLSCAAALSIAVFAPAQLTHTIPNGTATRAGSSFGPYPWGDGFSGTGSLGIRVMAVYGSVNFTAATPPINRPIVITRLKWRIDESRLSWTSGTFATASIRLSTAALAWHAVTP